MCALRTSPTAKFLSPPCGFVAPSGRYDRGRSHRQLRSLRSLAGCYDCVALRADDAAGVTPGGTSDSIGAVYGQISGAYYGLSAIPAEWREAVKDWKKVDDFIVDFLHAAKCM